MFIEHCLVQAKNGNPQHFILEGERGIGKSSLLLLEDLVARGDLETTNDEILCFITIDISLQSSDDFYDIIKKITDALRKEVANRERFKTIVFGALEFLSKIEAAGVRYNRESSKVDESELLGRLQADIINIISSFGPDDHGILLLIDEADRPPAEAGLGLICKLLTEEMSKRAVDRLCIGLAGLPGLVQRLHDSHESSPRIFHVLDLKPLEPDERIEVLKKALEEASKKNGFEISMTDEAQQMISNLSEGYPHFLQEFAYCAFEEDDDNTIDTDDVVGSIFAENGAFDQLGKKYFDRYYTAVYSDKYRDVLIAIAGHGDEWVDRKTIIKESNLSDGTVDNALRALKEKKVIIQSDLRRGEYRLPTRSFAAWIKVKKAAERQQERANEPSLFDEEPTD